MNFDFCDLVFNVMNHIVQLQKHINLYYPVVKGAELCQFFSYIINQFNVCIKVHSLNVNVHSITIFYSETINKELIQSDHPAR